ncbi:MAG: hypothetical protein GX372_07965 [Ignavibacteria bacterium]|jgi:hypothetical protein|nr:hypothetical protein [Ignavibacteria bacterium]
MKNTKLALNALILAGILFLASSCSDNSVDCKRSPQDFLNSIAGTTTENYVAVFLMQSEYWGPTMYYKEEKRWDLVAYLTENGEFVNPKFAKCNGINMFELVNDYGKGQYKYSATYYVPEFNVEIGGYLGGTLAFTAPNNMIRFTNLAVYDTLDTLDQNNFEISYTGVDPSLELFVEVSSQLGNVMKKIESPEATGTITFTAEELSKIGKSARIDLQQSRSEPFSYQNKPMLKLFIAHSVADCYVKN